MAKQGRRHAIVSITERRETVTIYNSEVENPHTHYAALELQLEPHARFTTAALPPERGSPCPICGRRGVSRPERIVIAAFSIRPHADLFRGQDLPTQVLGTERFADAVRKRQLTDVALREVEVDTAS